MAGRVLVRFWQAAQDANSEDQTLTLRAEVEYIMYVGLLKARLTPYHYISSAALAKLGGRVPLARQLFLDFVMFPILSSLTSDRCHLMLNEMATRSCTISSFGTVE